ncbi:hypothetical protein LX36DRAFT_730393 [Colletotrichum falcatum]|nr:hypothetical protein LX36DRAFT_730393 [Colletotrichum falcatum]
MLRHLFKMASLKKIGVILLAATPTLCRPTDNQHMHAERDVQSESAVSPDYEYIYKRVHPGDDGLIIYKEVKREENGGVNPDYEYIYKKIKREETNAVRPDYESMYKREKPEGEVKREENKTDIKPDYEYIYKRANYKQENVVN